MIEPATQTGIIGTFGLDGWKFLAQLVDFGIVLFVMWKWVYTPLLSVMDKRSKDISDGLKHAEEAKRALADAQSEKERMLKESRQLAQESMKEAIEKADAVRSEKMQQAKDEIEKIVNETRAQIKQERDATFVALRGDVANLVSLAMTKVARATDEDAQHKLIAEAIKDIENA